MDRQLNSDEAFEFAFSCHKTGDTENAKATYLRILEAVPEEPRSLHFLGILLHQEEKSDLALSCVKRSIELFPDSPDWRNDLGNILADRGDFAGAVAEFESAIVLMPGNPVYWNNLGAVQDRCGRSAEAYLSFQEAIAIDPFFGDALINLASLLDREGRQVEATEYHCRAYVLAPTHGKPKSMLGIAYCRLGRLAEAAEIYREWMFEEPDNPIPKHHFLACSKAAVPLRASDDYVEKHFDRSAANFDFNLNNIAYRGPEMIGRALERVAADSRGFSVLDAGCGTGLCASMLSVYAKRLIGVDLSSAMLDEAKKRGLYHELVKCEITHYLAEHPDCFDLVAAADTLIYFGALEELFSAAYSALRPGGFLVFTVEDERSANATFSFNPNGRYSHGKDYLDTLLLQSGFELLAMDSDIIRVEFGMPVAGLTITVRRKL
ncbi:magnesium-protoporphyrin O-methyltransferase [mine drainage metagenome]|uniref:Magnesium-protoporphyrin O-methyltransferase n=1 Tax=mine drainage metagenome TaxID=410659 RepID=A0A1J5SZW5_9ZZZZ